MIENGTIFKSYKDFEKQVFPKEYKKRERELLIQEIGFGKYLAMEFLNYAREKLEEI